MASWASQWRWLSLHTIQLRTIKGNSKIKKYDTTILQHTKNMGSLVMIYLLLSTFFSQQIRLPRMSPSHCTRKTELNKWLQMQIRYLYTYDHRTHTYDILLAKMIK